MTATAPTDWDWQRLHLLADDPELAELVELARLPLDIDLDTGRHFKLKAAVTRPARPAPPARVILPDAVIAEISAHAAEASGGMEVGGRLVVAPDGRIRRYVPRVNLASEPHRFRPAAASFRLAPDEFTVGVHSHPAGLSATPSAADLRYAKRYARTVGKTFAIFHVESRGLRVFVANPSGGFNEVPVEVVRDAATLPRAFVASASSRTVRRPLFPRFRVVKAGRPSGV